jgi:5-carboxymethyl-2-hydroxymuconate isomerase
MPHLILEYSGNLTAFDVPDVLQALNQVVADSGIVSDLLDLKARAVRLDDFYVGTTRQQHSGQGFVHLTLLLLEGRTDSVKRALTRQLLACLEQRHYPPALQLQFSVELRDMAPAYFAKTLRPAQTP